MSSYNLYFGPVVDIQAGKATSHNFLINRGNVFYGSFQIKSTPRASTFALDVIRASGSTVIRRAFLAGVAPTEENQYAASNLDNRTDTQKYNDISGGVCLEGLPPDLYIMRFSQGMKNPSDPPKFQWEYKVDLSAGDHDFSIQYADFAKYRDQLKRKWQRQSVRHYCRT